MDVSDVFPAAISMTRQDFANVLGLSGGLLEALPIAVYTTDAAGRITGYNKAAVDLWGTRPDPGTTCASWQLYWPDGAQMPHDQCPMTVALRENRPIRGVEALLEQPDGTRVPFLAYPSPVRDEAGALIGAVNVLVDISGRKRAEETELQLVSIVENSDDAIASKNLNGVVTSWNRGAERLFGYTAEEIVGESITILLPEDRRDEEATILDRLRRGERVDHYETVRRRKDGTLVDISLTVSPIKNAAGRIIGASKIARDITERRRAEQKERLLAREVDHRAKNVLAVVQAIVRLTRADSAAEYVERLSGRLAALARAHTLMSESRWVGTRLTRMIEEEFAAFRTGDDRRVRISGPELTVTTDVVQSLAMVLHELATNAAKYGALSAPAGRVGITWSWDDDAHLVLQWTETGGPAVQEPRRRGFGTALIETTVGGQLGGTVSFDWATQGLVCRIRIPRRKLFDESPEISAA